MDDFTERSIPRSNPNRCTPCLEGAHGACSGALCGCVHGAAAENEAAARRGRRHDWLMVLAQDEWAGEWDRDEGPGDPLGHPM